MISIYDVHIWYPYMIFIYDIHIWISYMDIIYGYHIWISYMDIIYGYHIWIAYMDVIYDDVWWKAMMKNLKSWLFSKMLGDVWNMFWHHDWCLRNYLEPVRNNFFSKKINTPKKLQNHLLIIFQPSIKSDLSYGADFDGFPFFNIYIFFILWGPLGPFFGPFGPLF